MIICMHLKLQFSLTIRRDERFHKRHAYPQPKQEYFSYLCHGKSRTDLPQSGVDGFSAQPQPPHHVIGHGPGQGQRPQADCQIIEEFAIAARPV